MWIHFTADDPTRVYDVRWCSQHRDAAGYEANSLCRRSCHPHHGEDRGGPHPHDGGHPEQRGELDAGKFPATGVLEDKAVLLIGGRRSGPITFRLGNEIVQPQSELRYLRVSRVGPANDLFQTRFVSGRESGKDCGNADEADVQLGSTLCYDLKFAVNRKDENVLEHSRTGSRTSTSGTGRVKSARGGEKDIKVEPTPFRGP
jgi:hypothetical protein